MEIIGDRTYVEIPGDKLHELPPLLVRINPSVKRLDKVMEMARDTIQTEDIISEEQFSALNDRTLESRKTDLAVNLVEQYLRFVLAWQWGDAISEWIRQCETTFQFTHELRAILRPDVWPHAGRSSFVTLLDDKAVKPEGIDLHRAFGIRLTFRHPPPIQCFSNQFLFYLNSSVSDTAYQTWSRLEPAPISSLPPERFTFQVVDM